MNVCILSLFRDAAANGQIERYFDQMHALSRLLSARGDWLTLLLGYGDSTDGTGEALHEEATFCLDTLLLDVSHGGKVYGSIEHPQRFKQLAFCGNTLLDHVPVDADVVGIVESDLIWDAETLLALIDHTAHVPAIAPLIMDGERSFYDIYAFRKNGKHFTKYPPYCEWLGSDLVQLDSAGSVLFVQAHYARKARLSDGEAIVGFCTGIREHGGSIWCDPTLSVAHPPYAGKQRPAAGGARNSHNLRVPAY